MDGRYTIEDGEIKLTLSEADFEGVLEDVSGCRDLLEPQIRIVDNMVVFRDYDIKMIDPTIFFIKDVPEFKPTKQQINNWISIIIIAGVISVVIGLQLTLFAGILIAILGIAVGFGIAISQFMSLQLEHNRRHRKALYAKAKLLSFFYMNVLEEMTTGSDRLERKSYRLEKDVAELKGRFRETYQLLNTEQKHAVGNKFPDGDVIETKPVSNIKYN